MELDLRGTHRNDWTAPAGSPEGFTTIAVYRGRDEQHGTPIEIAVARWTKKDRIPRDSLAKLHALRVNKRATPVVLAIEVDNDTIVTFGPNSSAAPLDPIPSDQAQRLFQAVLDEPTALLARARLAAHSQAIDSTTIPGVKNSGLFANHELRVGVPQRPDWPTACASGIRLLDERGQSLISKLGYKIALAGANALVLTGTGPRPHALAVLLNDTEGFDTESPRFSVSPIAYGLAMAERQGVPWLILARGSQLRLYPARVDLGVGRKGLAETFTEVDLPHLTKDNAGYLPLLFSADALAEGGTAFQILDSSTQYAVALGERLRDKVYEEIIPDLALAVAQQLQVLGYEMDVEGLDLAYQLTLRIFFRLLFQVYAEDRRLLPFKENDKYTRNALKTVAQDLVDNPTQQFDPESSSLWDDMAQVWRVIDTGDRSWNVPAYNGGLFTSDPELNPHGELIAQLRINNGVMGPVLQALLLDDTDDGQSGPIDFRSLSVREFGTIYEGLLESSLGMAEVDLTLDDKGTWLPAVNETDEIYAYAGQVYFHNTSGQRKGTGSYFTPSFVVEHLLDRSLDPALDDHLQRISELIKKGDQAGAADLFFDFKVADLAMGSGHFLTAAIDHIEAKMAAFLAEAGNHIPGVAKELSLLLQTAKEVVGPDAPEPEPSSLLRRQIARRCVYGLDINPIAVELARVSIWIHTFVRGLPMSSLNHNLVCANSLTGIGTVGEALDVLSPDRRGAITFYDEQISEALEKARGLITEVANSPELNRQEVRTATAAIKRAEKETDVVKRLFDAAVLLRLRNPTIIPGDTLENTVAAASRPEAQEELKPLQSAHMPVLFPEVFLRENSGFDVLIGNPPWEKLKVEVSRWWALRFPGLRSLPQGEQDALIERLRKDRPDLAAEHDADVERNAIVRNAVIKGPFPGIGTGDPDLYQAFAWRNWSVLRCDGRLGVVMPRSLIAEAGGAEWRKTVFDQGEFSDVTIIVNSARWVFDIHAQWSVAFLSVRKLGRPGVEVALCGPFNSRAEYDAARDKVALFPSQEFRTWGTGAAFPILSSAEDSDVYRVMKRHPRLDADLGDWRARPYAEFHASGDKKIFALDEVPDGWRPLYKGESFNIWNPDTGLYYGGINPLVVEPMLYEKRLKTSRMRNSPFSEFEPTEVRDIATLPFNNARVALRLVTNKTNARTVIVALVPPQVGLTHGAPYLLFPRGGKDVAAYLLGVLSSIPLDWIARRTVEVNLTYHILNSFPIPRPDPEDPLRRRVVVVSGRLAASDERFQKWASSIGVQVASVQNAEEKGDLEAELDALISHLYGLSRPQVQHIFKSFHRGWDYKPRLDAVLAHYDRIGGAKS